MHLGSCRKTWRKHVLDKGTVVLIEFDPRLSITQLIRICLKDLTLEKLITNEIFKRTKSVLLVNTIHSRIGLCPLIFL